MEFLTIGQVARQSNVGVETIRFYERQGLIPPPPRRSSGYRSYTQEVIQRIRFIRRAKELGFTLPEIGELLALRDSNGACHDVRPLLQRKQIEVKEKLQALDKINASLERLLGQCAATPNEDACPLFAVIEGEEPL
jgi:Hg(II)-responsive transcriptional regulator